MIELHEAVQASYEQNMKALGVINMKIDVIGPSIWWIEMRDNLRESITGNKALAKKHGFKLNNDFIQSINEEGHKYMEFEEN